MKIKQNEWFSKRDIAWLVVHYPLSEASPNAKKWTVEYALGVLGVPDAERNAILQGQQGEVRQRFASWMAERVFQRHAGASQPAIIPPTAPLSQFLTGSSPSQPISTSPSPPQLSNWVVHHPDHGHSASPGKPSSSSRKTPDWFQRTCSTVSRVKSTTEPSKFGTLAVLTPFDQLWENGMVRFLYL